MGMIIEFWAFTSEEIQEMLQKSEDDFCEFVYEKHPADIDTDKSWDGLDYLMRQATGKTDFPIGFFHLGTPLGFLAGNWGDDDPGARWFNEEETTIIADFLDTFNRERLHEHFDPSKMDKEQIYPTIWTRDNEEAFDYIYAYFEIIRDFFRKAADAKSCVITIFS